jgi:hypothetical protein
MTVGWKYFKCIRYTLIAANLDKTDNLYKYNKIRTTRKADMKRQLLELFLIVTILQACDNNKSYKYVEITGEQDVFGGIEKKEKEAKIIKASSDSAAYLDAFQSFCISLKVNMDMKQTLGTVYSTPVKFKLLNDKGEDIAKTVYFIDKERKEKEITEQIFTMNNTLQKSVDKSKEDKAKQFQASAKIDSSKIKDLTKYFRKKKDEFSNINRIWYEPKSAPQHANRNGLYCYFQTENGMPSNLRLRFQYYAEDWLFFSRIQFAIDGKAYEYIPDDTETDSGDGGNIWEWCDQSLLQADKELIYALANAKSAKMKIIGRQYHNQKTISQEQIKSIKQALELYNALGGKY